MTYRELLKLYKTGQLDEDTRRKVEEDVEKQEAISEYLFEEDEIPTLEEALPMDGEPEGEDRFTAQIQKTIRRTFIKLGVTVGAVVMVAVLAVLFVLPKAVDHLYYDPTESLEGVTPDGDWVQPRIYTDLAVWTELFVPSDYRTNAVVEPLGYGKYDITISNTWGGNHASNAVRGMLTRNRMTIYDPGAFNRDRAVFRVPEKTEEEVEYWRDFSFQIAEEDMDDDTFYTAYFILSEPTDYETLSEWCMVNHLWNRLWFKVDTGDGPDVWGGLGFCAGSVDGSRLLRYNEEKYPELGSGILLGWEGDPERAKTHFLNLLAYTKDNPEFARAMGTMNEQMEAILDQTAEHVEKNGLKLRGFSVVGKKADILAVKDDPMVCYLMTTPAY